MPEGVRSCQNQLNYRVMIRFEATFTCADESEVIDALNEIIYRIEGGYVCGYLTDVGAEGDWGISEEED